MSSGIGALENGNMQGMQRNTRAQKLQIPTHDFTPTTFAAKPRHRPHLAGTMFSEFKREIKTAFRDIEGAVKRLEQNIESIFEPSAVEGRQMDQILTTQERNEEADNKAIAKAQIAKDALSKSGQVAVETKIAAAKRRSHF